MSKFTLILSLTYNWFWPTQICYVKRKLEKENTICFEILSGKRIKKVICQLLKNSKCSNAIFYPYIVFYIY